VRLSRVDGVALWYIWNAIRNSSMATGCAKGLVGASVFPSTSGPFVAWRYCGTTKHHTVECMVRWVKTEKCEVRACDLHCASFKCVPTTSNNKREEIRGGPQRTVRSYNRTTSSSSPLYSQYVCPCLVAFDRRKEVIL
jgi:hypothetical protein